MHSVRTLSIQLPLRSPGPNRGQRAPIPRQQLITLLQPLPNLQELALSSNLNFPSTYIERCRFTWDVSYGNLLRNLRELDLWMPVFISPGAVRQNLTTCPSLISLCIAEADYKPKHTIMTAPSHAQSDHVGNATDVPGISSIQRLKFIHTPVSASSIIAAPFLQSPPSNLRVRELTIDLPNDQMGYQSPLSDLCKACSTSLEQLKISMIVLGEIASSRFSKIGHIYPDIYSESAMICPAHGESCGA